MLRGARTILAHARLRRLLLVGWLAPMFAVVPEALARPYVAAHHGSATLVGWWLVALPVGLVGGDIAGVRLLTPRQQRRLVAAAAATGFVPYLAFAFDPPIPIALSLLVASGAWGLYILGLDARVCDAVPPNLFARTMTLNSAWVMTMQDVGFTLAGAIAQSVGPPSPSRSPAVSASVQPSRLLRSDLRPRQRHVHYSGCR